MQVFRGVDEIREWREHYRIDQTSIAIIQTKGNIHDGHISLSKGIMSLPQYLLLCIVRQAKMECDLVVVTLFVNRLEFDSEKNFKGFPRNEASDLKKLDQLGYVDVVFVPEQDELDLKDEAVPIAEETFEMARRPELFKGKSIVLLGLLKLIEPSQIYVGLDCIQLQRHLCYLMDSQPIPVEVVGVPLCRRSDGLPYNTQVDRMTNAEVEIAKRVFPCLLSIIEEYLGGELDSKMMVRRARYELECPDLLVDYFTLVEAETFGTLEMVNPDKGGILIIGVTVKGKHMLMDNVVLAPLDRSKPKFFSRRATINH